MSTGTRFDAIVIGAGHNGLTAAATLALVGMALLAPSFAVVFKLAVVWLFLFLTGPTSSHALANAAHTAGLQPLIGRVGSENGGQG